MQNKIKQSVFDLVKRKQPIRFALLCSLVLSILLLPLSAIDKIMLLIAASSIIWLGYLLQNFLQNLVTILFTVAFFVFLIGRETLEILFQIRRNDYNPSVNLYAYTEIGVSLLLIILMHFLLSQISAHLNYKNHQIKHLLKTPKPSLNKAENFQINLGSKKISLSSPIYRKSLVILLCVFSLFGFYVQADALIYVFQHGYKSLYLTYPIYLAKHPILSILKTLSGSLTLIFAATISLNLTKRQFYFSYGFYSIYLLLSLITGQRYRAVVGMLVILLSLLLRYQKTVLYYLQHRFGRVAALSIGAIVILSSSMTLVEKIRGTSQSVFSNPIFSFFYQQGVSILTLKKEIVYGDLLNSNGNYALSFWYFGLFGRLRGETVYHGNTIENALYGHNLTSALTYLTDQKLYLSGGGIGSSYLAETHNTFGFPGIIVSSILLGIMLYWMDKFGTSYLGNCLRFTLIFPILWMPRGETTGFISELFQPANFLAVFCLLLIIIGIKSIQIFRLRTSNWTKDVLYSIVANGTSMFVMGLLTFILPKIISHQDFSLWQAYVLWAIYGGYLTLGLTDGAYIMYSGKRYSELPKEKITLQLNLLLATHLTIIFGTGIALISISPKIVWWPVILGTVISSLFYVPRTLLTNLFQTTGRIKAYSLVTIIERGSYGILILLGILFGWQSLAYIVYSDVVVKAFAFLISIWLGRKSLTFSGTGWSEGIKEIKTSMKIGLQILIANLASILINGIIRLIIQARWGLSAFGYVSLAFTISNFVITFMLAVSIVIFPYLSRLNKQVYQRYYLRGATLSTVLLAACLILYFPISEILYVWLPEYSFSLTLMGILFPMLLFEARYRLLDNNFLKALRLESFLMVNNLLSVVLAVILGYFTAYYLNNIKLVVGMILLVLAIRCVSAEIWLAKKMQLSLNREIINNLVISGVFVFLVINLDSLTGFLTFSIILGILFWLYYPQIMSPESSKIRRFKQILFKRLVPVKKPIQQQVGE